MAVQGGNHGNIIKFLRISFCLSSSLCLFLLFHFFFSIWISVCASLLCEGLHGISLKSKEASKTCVLLLRDAVRVCVLVPGTGPESLMLQSSQGRQGAGYIFLVI